MTRRSLRIPLLALTGAFLGLGIPGCQFAYEYEVRGRIKSSADGSPLTGVMVTLKASSLFTESGPVWTGPDGSFVLGFEVSDGAFSPRRMPQWSLTLVKEGYVDEVIDISPAKEPTSSKTTNTIVVVGYLRAKH